MSICDTSHATPLLCRSCADYLTKHRRYDDGLQDITNVDFVEAVVRDMMRRNLRQRPRMRWLVMDMTQMDKVCTTSRCRLAAVCAGKTPEDLMVHAHCSMLMLCKRSVTINVMMHVQWVPVINAVHGWGL